MTEWWELSDRATREIANGQLFLASLLLLVVMVTWLVPRIAREPRPWRHTIDVRLGWAITLLVLASAIRAGWVWTLLVVDRLDGDGAPNYDRALTVLKSMDWIIVIAVILWLWAVVCILKVLVPSRYAPRQVYVYVACVTLFSAVVPVILYLVT